MMLTTKTARRICKLVGITGVSRHNNEDINWEIAKWLELAPLEDIRSAIDADEDLKEVALHHSFRPVTVQAIVDGLGDCWRHIPVGIHNGYCTDCIESLTKPSRKVLQGAFYKDADYCVSTWFQGKRENVKADKVYNVRLGFCLMHNIS